MPTHKLLLLAGDGIGPEVMAEVRRLLAYFAKAGIAMFQTDGALAGGCSYDAHKGSTPAAIAKTRDITGSAYSEDSHLTGGIAERRLDFAKAAPRPRTCQLNTATSGGRSGIPEPRH